MKNLKDNYTKEQLIDAVNKLIREVEKCKEMLRILLTDGQ
jgi:hypothetical protein